MGSNLGGRGLLGCVVAFTHTYAERYVERFTVTPCSETLVMLARRIATHPEKISNPDLGILSPTLYPLSHPVTPFGAMSKA